jgi:hypothetical protein
LVLIVSAFLSFFKFWFSLSKNPVGTASAWFVPPVSTHVFKAIYLRCWERR